MSFKCLFILTEILQQKRTKSNWCLNISRWQWRMVPWAKSRHSVLYWKLQLSNTLISVAYCKFEVWIPPSSKSPFQSFNSPLTPFPKYPFIIASLRELHASKSSHVDIEPSRNHLAHRGKNITGGLLDCQIIQLHSLCSNTEQKGRNGKAGREKNNFQQPN